MNACIKAYSDEDINKEPVPLHMVAMTEYLRTKIRGVPDRGDLSKASGVAYGRLTYFVNNHGATLGPADMQALMDHFGIVGAVKAA
ncbi:hypothetical protein [Mesorhizobium sp.]|uniref:hypothetical protein n=1 Tax=Mesorhizobium sp. TaxID=1871066 RepID=UPI000FE5F28E|nr:hypothetical protein [Mesorhizobium sp.]RWO89556.1 MAG: hypothetical protein EOQ96_05190 [Mesorhizobium sp.]